jgi:hypothetical protein
MKLFPISFLQSEVSVSQKWMDSNPAWRSGHRVRLQNRRSRVRIPPGCKVFWFAVQRSCHYLKCIAIVCFWENKFLQNWNGLNNK